MTEEQTVQLLKVLRAEQIHIKGNGWVTSTCPLAPWTHKKGHDIKPSFGIKVNEGGRSFFHCFSCRTGSVEELVQTMEMLNVSTQHKYDFKIAHSILSNELAVVPLSEYVEFDMASVKFQPWPSWWLDQFLPAKDEPEAAAYLTTREVPEEVWSHFDLRFDPKKKMIVAPYFSSDGKLAGARGRSILPTAVAWQKHYDYTYGKTATDPGINNAHCIWYNEKALHLPGPVVVVEGQFDCWRVWQAYPKVVAALTAKTTLEKMRKLCYSSKVIQIPDGDSTGEQSILRYQKQCTELGLPFIAAIMAPGPKDPDECHVNYLKALLEPYIA